MRAQLNILSLVSLRKTAVKALRVFVRPEGRRKRKLSALFEAGEALSFRLNGHSVRGRRWKPSLEVGRRVLIAHGFGASSAAFEPYVSALLKKGCEVVAFDAPGHGRSGGKRLFITDYVRMLTQIEQSYGPFQSWLGHSLGGLALALSLEDSVSDGRSRLALVAPAPELAAAVEEWAGMMQLPAAVVREIDEYVRVTSGHPLAWYGLRRAIGSIGAEILYVQDEGDAVVAPDTARVIEGDGHRNIQFLFTTGLGHRKVYKDPDVMERIVDFL